MLVLALAIDKGFRKFLNCSNCRDAFFQLVACAVSLTVFLFESKLKVYILTPGTQNFHRNQRGTNGVSNDISISRT